VCSSDLGCSIIRLPDDFAGSIGSKRGRILNNMVAALRCYFSHVIVGDPEDLVVVDPQAGGTLRAFLETMPEGRVLTPLGFELVRHADAPVGDAILGPWCHLRPAPQYSKPCIISTTASLSRNGQFSRYDTLFTPEPLYLLNLRAYAHSASPTLPPVPTEGQDGFDFTLLRARMHDTWQKRDTSGYWSFELPQDDRQYRLPERFFGMF